MKTYRLPKKDDKGEVVFNLLGFQYKPLEKQMLKELKETGHSDLAKSYATFGYARKIAILDKFAEMKGL